MRTSLVPMLSRRMALLVICGLLPCACAADRAWAQQNDDLRRTPMVRAVQKAIPAVVSINGEKSVPPTPEQFAHGEAPRQVNGMGTGVIVDERGYIVTNHHVVDQVRDIRVTLSDGATYTGRTVAYDRDVDLAVLKINAPRDLPVISLGKSSDLMIAEPVIAVGNAFGYEQTVTSGLISSLHRSVQVSDAQQYEDLIQTSAGINPGNSGGPLLNIYGEMIGVNVAVRAGAQSIAFAIPVDKVLEVTARLMSIRQIDRHRHGVTTEEKDGGLVVTAVEPDSPAAEVGLQVGDVLTSVDARQLRIPLDLERALLGRQVGTPIEVKALRDGRTLALDLVLAEASAGPRNLDDRSWEMFGLRLSPIPPQQFREHSSYYRGGLSITDVRPDSPAYREGIRSGDILVGIHRWQTVSLENVSYVLKREDLAAYDPIKLWILRGNETFYGLLSVASHTTPPAR